MILSEDERTSLMSRIVEAVRREDVPCDVQNAALTLVGWLARRYDHECPCTCGVVEALKQTIGIP